MNIIILDEDFKANAEMYNDIHLVSQIKEHTQMMMSAYYYSSSHAVHDKLAMMRKDGLYKLTHKNHPCTKWTRLCFDNWQYLWLLTQELDKERKFRKPSAKEHKSITKLRDIIKKYGTPDLPVSESGKTPFALVTASDCKDPNKSVAENYRDYYINHKQHLAKWKTRGMPSWYVLKENV